MVSPIKRDLKVSKTLSKFEVIFEAVFLSEEKDNERIKRLAEQILECIEYAKKRKKTRRKVDEFSNEVFAGNLEKVFGL